MAAGGSRLTTEATGFLSMCALCSLMGRAGSRLWSSIRKPMESTTLLPFTTLLHSNQPLPWRCHLLCSFCKCLLAPSSSGVSSLSEILWPISPRTSLEPSREMVDGRSAETIKHHFNQMTPLKWNWPQMLQQEVVPQSRRTTGKTEKNMFISLFLLMRVPHTLTFEPWHLEFRTNVYIGSWQEDQSVCCPTFRVHAVMWNKRVNRKKSIQTRNTTCSIFRWIKPVFTGYGAACACFSHTTCHTHPVTLRGVSLLKDKRPRTLRTGSSGRFPWSAWRGRLLLCDLPSCARSHTEHM